MLGHDLHPRINSGTAAVYPLFQLYGGRRAGGDPWEEELDLHPATVNLLNLLLKRESEDDAVYQRHIEQACEALEVSRYSLKQALCGPNVQSKVIPQNSTLST